MREDNISRAAVEAVLQQMYEKSYSARVDETLSKVRQAIRSLPPAPVEGEGLLDGNSPEYWRDKAKAYGQAVTDAWAALKAAGVHPGGGKDVTDGIRELARRAALSQTPGGED